MKNAWRSSGAGAALIVLLTVTLYIPAMRGGFIWDDEFYITQDRLVRASDGLYRFWFTMEGRDYYPLTGSLWWFEWRLWGTHAPGYHVVNVLLHAANAVLVWLILRRLKIPGPWVAALVFAVHPVNVATVAWISEQKNTLSMLFYTLSILLYLRFDEENRSSPTLTRGWPRSERRWPRSERGKYVLSLTAFLLALFSKTAVVMLPVVLLGCVWWRHGKVRWQDLRRSVPFFAFSLMMGLVTVWFHDYHILKGRAVLTGGFLSRLAGAGWAPWFYLYKALLPFDLNVVYPKWEINASSWVSYVPGMALVGCFAFFWRKRRTWGRPLLFGLGYFVVTLFPVLGFFDQSFYAYSLVADHWQYYAIVGIIALVIAAGAAIGRRMGQQSRYADVLMGAILLAVLAVATWRRSCVYADDETLWRENVSKNPKAWVAHDNLGTILVRLGKAEEAIRHWEQALRIKPNDAMAHYNLGLALLRTGKAQEAIEHFDQALQLKPDDAETHCHWGVALAQLGRMPEAIRHYEQALRIKPDYAEAHYYLGVALIRLNRVPEATAHWEQAVRFKPDYAEAQYNLGIALEQAGRLKEAIAHLQQAVRIKPGFAEAHYNLAVALARLGRLPEAIGHWEQALRIKPDYAEAHYNLGLELSQVGKIQDAIGHFEQALKLKPDYADAHYNLGLVLEQTGNTRDAIGHYEQALKIKPDAPALQNNLAWLLATLAPTDGGNPVRAVTLAERACEATSNKVPAYLDTLAAAYAAAGRFTDAVATAQKAIELARAAGLPQVANEIETHLELYRAGRPYRQLRTSVLNRSLDATGAHNP